MSFSEMDAMATVPGNATACASSNFFSSAFNPVDV